MILARMLAKFSIKAWNKGIWRAISKTREKYLTVNYTKTYHSKQPELTLFLLSRQKERSVRQKLMSIHQFQSYTYQNRSSGSLITRIGDRTPLSKLTTQQEVEIHLASKLDHKD